MASASPSLARIERTETPGETHRNRHQLDPESISQVRSLSRSEQEYLLHMAREFNRSSLASLGVDGSGIFLKTNDFIVLEFL